MVLWKEKLDAVLFMLCLMAFLRNPRQACQTWLLKGFYHFDLQVSLKQKHLIKCDAEKKKKRWYGNREMKTAETQCGAMSNHSWNRSNVQYVFPYNLQMSQLVLIKVIGPLHWHTHWHTHPKPATIKCDPTWCWISFGIRVLDRQRKL